MFNRKNQAGSSTVGALVVLALVVAGLYGYLDNILKFFDLIRHDSLGGLVRLVGILLPPVGAIAGYF
jgi:hypothetical protein